MHYYCLARGDMLQVDKFMSDVRARAVPFKYHPTEPPGILEVAVRRIELLEIAFPEEHKNFIIGMLGNIHSDKSKIKRALAYPIRKLLGATPVKPGEVVPLVPGNGGIIRPFVDIVDIGIKKDGYRCKANPATCNKFSRKKEICCGHPMTEDL